MKRLHYCSLQIKERQLQDTLRAQTSALQQSGRLIDQYRLKRNDFDQETTKLRTLLQETESKYEQTLSQLTAVNSEMDRSRSKGGQLERMVAEKEQELEAYRELDADNKLK